jgi:hypothetical protein
MNCDCWKRVDEHLKQYNGRIASALAIAPGNQLVARMLVTTEKIDSKLRKPVVPLLTVSFCPFCGTKATPDESKEPVAEDQLRDVTPNPENQPS